MKITKLKKTLIYIFKKHGLNVLGVDPAKEIAKKASSNGIKTLPKFMNLTLSKDIRKNSSLILG